MNEKMGNAYKVEGSGDVSEFHDPSIQYIYYPVFINLNKKRCVVVGGGKVAERKVYSLLRSGADVTVISPEITDNLRKYKDKGRIEHIGRKYRNGDLRDAFLVIAATSDEKTNHIVSRDAPFLVNVVDKPEMGNFIVPSIVRRGPLTIAITTSGSSPAVSKTIRKELEIFYNKDFGDFLVFLKQVRSKIMKDIKDKKEREKLLKIFGSKDVLDILRTEGLNAAKNKILESLG